MPPSRLCSQQTTHLTKGSNAGIRQTTQPLASVHDRPRSLNLRSLWLNYHQKTHHLPPQAYHVHSTAEMSLTQFHILATAYKTLRSTHRELIDLGKSLGCPKVHGPEGSATRFTPLRLR